MSKPFAKLRGRMAEVGYSQRDMAKSLGISKATFSIKVNAKRDFTLTELRTMAKVLNIEDPKAYFFD